MNVVSICTYKYIDSTYNSKNSRITPESWEPSRDSVLETGCLHCPNSAILGVFTGEESVGSSGHKAECLGNPSLAPEIWRVTGELLVSSPWWTPGNTGSDINEGITSRDRINQLSGKREPEPAKGKMIFLLLCPLYLGCYQMCSPQLG